MPGPDRRSFLLGAGLAASSVGAPRARAASLPASRCSAAPADLRSLIEPERIAKAMASDDIPGAAVCLVHDGKPSWIEGFGVTDRHSNRGVDADTIFSIQSTSKHITATGIMLAVQHGILDLDEPITSYLPDFTVGSRFETAPQEKMTLRLLMSHRAGFTHEAPVGNNYDPAFPSFEAHIRSISNTWLRHPVGERYRYSNLGFDLAGYILQIRSARSFAEWIQTMGFYAPGNEEQHGCHRRLCGAHQSRPRP